MIPVVVGVARVDLVDVVVDVGHHARRHHAGEAHGLELEEGHGAVGVGEQHLVDGDPDLLAGHGLAGDEVLLDELAREAPAHGSALVARHPGARLRPDVLGAGADEAVVVVLLDDVGRPAGDAAGGDDRA